MRRTKFAIYKGEAVKWAGSPSGLAVVLGITRQAVHQWPMGRPIPKKHYAKLLDEGFNK